jgi:hypothetical protein
MLDNVQFMIFLGMWGCFACLYHLWFMFAKKSILFIIVILFGER